MNGFEQRLKRSLAEVRDAGRLGVEARRAVAREELFRRMHRRRLRNFFGGALLAGAAAVAGLMLFTTNAADPITEGADIDAVQVPAPARAVVEVGDEPRHVAVGGLKYVWSSNAGSNDVSRIDPSRNEVVTTVDVGSPPGDMAIGKGPVWVALPEEGHVVEIGPSAGTIVGDPIVIADGPVDHMELSVGAGALWIVARDEGLWRVDIVTREVLRIEGVLSPTDVAVEQDTLLVLSADGSIYRLSSVTGAVLGEPLEIEPTDDGEITLAAGSLWYFAEGGDTISRLDPASGELLDEIDPPGAVVDFAIDPEVAWVLSADGDTHHLTPVDRAEASFAGEPLEVQGGPAEAVIAGGSLWVTLSEENVVLRFSKYR